jgi:transposase
LLPLVLPDPGLCLDRVEITAEAVTLCLRTTASAAPCPRCAQPARQVHSSYARFAHDLPIQGRPALLRLTTRRFFCCTADCPRRVFCEQFPGLLAKHAQATTRLSDTHRALGLALGGEPGARLAAKLGMPTSPDTLLRRVKQSRPNSGTAPSPRVVGVDDWALRKGHTYGTIIIDLERSTVLELLPGRDGAELKTWLGKHPEVEILSRDRWASFADAASVAAPQAQQVADRWHLLKNAREALERFLDRYAGRIATAFSAPAQATATAAPGPPALPEVVPLPPSAPLTEVASSPSAATAESPPQQRPMTARQQRRRERHREVRRLHAEGQSLRHIARALHLSRNTVLRYARTEQCPDWRPGRTRRMGSSLAAPHAERIEAWLAAGNRNVAELHRQLQAEDMTLGYHALLRFVTRRLAARGERPDRVPVAPPAPSAKGLSFAVIARPAERKEKQQTQVARLREMDVAVAETVGLVEGFAALIRKQGGTTLQDWQEKARISASIELRRFAEGLGRDQAAVQAALDQPWSNGPVEGHVNRLKTIKRQMYGRAGLSLLRARVLHAG